MKLGRYEIGRVLGEGGGGRVYDAVRVGPGSLRRPVAIKVLHRGADALRREARLGGLLRHQNLVDVYEIGEHEGTWFCAMERCDGTIAGHMPLPPRAVVEVGLAVCAALTYAHHELGLVHLDLKPSNLLLLDGTVKVADLGVARIRGSDERGVRGTPGYMAPEQATGAAVDARADIYALGVTLVELATGVRPTVTPATVDLTDLDAPGSEPSGIPAWLATVAERCLAADRADRWPDMPAVARALRKLDVPAPGLRDVLGPPATTARGSGPSDEPDAFVGRRSELEALADALETPGIVALKGPPGVGKSRLSSAGARRWMAATGRPAWVAALTDARSPDDLARGVAEALDVPLGAGDPLVQLGHALAGRGALVVVLDNADGLEGRLGAVERWCTRAPEARFVVTSRSGTGLVARVLEVGPLAPADARALLVERAAERGVEIALDPDLSELAERLEGLPLALELAAGRLGVLRVREVIERLGWSLLRRGTEDRHGTLRAALDWGWELSTAIERDALAQLSVFAGGAPLEAVEAVLQLPAGTGVPAVVDALVERSWVALRDGRVHVLEAVRAYAAERLVDVAAAEARHGRFFAAIDSAAVTESELENVYAACRRAVDRGDGSVAVPTLEAAVDVLSFRGPFDRAVALAETVAGLATLRPPELARVHAAAGLALRLAGRPDEARSHYEEALRRLRQVPDRWTEALAQSGLGNVLREQGRMDGARTCLEAALTLYRDLGDRDDEGTTLCWLGIVHYGAGRVDEGRTCIEQALAIHRETGSQREIGSDLANLAVLHYDQGRIEAARSLLEQALVIHRDTGNRRMEGTTLSNLGALAYEEGRVDEARTCVEDALAIQRRLGYRHFEGEALAQLGMIHHATGHADAASDHLRAALAIHRELSDHLSEGNALAYLGQVYEELGQAEAAHEHYVAALAVHRAIGVVRVQGAVLAGLARLEIRKGEAVGAEALVAEGLAVAGSIGDLGGTAELLAARAEAQWAMGDRTGARRALDEATAAAPPGFLPLARALARLRARLSQEG